jgi:hypothetical protein
MRTTLAQIVRGTAYSAVLGGIFAIAANFIFGRNLIGFSIISSVGIGAVFGIVGALLIQLAAAIAKKSSTLFFAGCGIAYGAVMYLLNVWLGLNAGFSLFGIALISSFGLMPGFGCLAAHKLHAGFANLQSLS